uniref:Uncharacterized protein n=1 Tax=Corethron hystrix TaxID=216773 RepID=A0A7S1BPN7_9STRA|mmetsp:Transcript_36501/g.85316  ORF Transcript_36501/g.85316 Transcript_36501/m.85316 type:complete len:335 (+) Transcript_36501:323-1327(+)
MATSNQCTTGATTTQELPWWENLLSSLTDNVWSECVSSTAVPAPNRSSGKNAVSNADSKVLTKKSSKLRRHKHSMDRKKGGKEDPPELSLISDSSSSSHALIDDAIIEEEEDDELVSLADTAAMQSRIYPRNLIRPAVSFMNPSKPEPTTQQIVYNKQQTIDENLTKIKKSEQLDKYLSFQAKSRRNENNKSSQSVQRSSKTEKHNTCLQATNESPSGDLKFISPRSARKNLFTTVAVDDGRLDEDGTRTPTIFKEAAAAMEAQETAPAQDVTPSTTRPSVVKYPRPVRLTASISSDDCSMNSATHDNMRGKLRLADSGEISEVSAFVPRRRGL